MGSVRALPNNPWVVARTYDLSWFISAGLSGFALLYLFLEWGVPAYILGFFWIAVADGPHIFSTYSRTYFDRTEWDGRSRLFLGSLLFFVIPGVFFLVNSRTGFEIYLVICQLWAYWHVVRQHYGFLALYQRKGREPSGIDNRLDWFCFYATMLLPFLHFLLNHPSARMTLGLSAELGSLDAFFSWTFFAGTLLAVFVYVLSQLKLLVETGRVNGPKNLFLLSAVPLHILVFLHPVYSTALPLALYTVLITFPHNVQYLGIVGFYHRNRNHVVFANRMLLFWLVGIVFGLSYRYVTWTLLGDPVPGLGGFDLSWTTRPLWGDFTAQDFGLGLVWGVATHHYYLDQKIWRLRGDQRLREDLRVKDR